MVKWPVYISHSSEGRKKKNKQTQEKQYNTINYRWSFQLPETFIKKGQQYVTKCPNGSPGGFLGVSDTSSRSCDTIFIQRRQIQPVKGRKKHRLKIISNFWSQESTMTLTDAILYITLFYVALITISVVAAVSRFGMQHVLVTLLASEHAHTHHTHRGTQKAHVYVSPDETRVKLTVTAKPGGSC